jgi:hypothetical protein
MCEEGTTRLPSSPETLRPVQAQLDLLSRYYAEFEQVEPHTLMPSDGKVRDLIDEAADNGFLKKIPSAVEFVHESFRDYFAGTELVAELDPQIRTSAELAARTPAEVADLASKLIWRHLKPGYYDASLRGRFDQALILSAGLISSADELLPAVFERNPLLAAHGAGARVSASTLEQLTASWLDLTRRPQAVRRWVGCQCFAAARVGGTAVTSRLAELVLRDDPNWYVSHAAARALTAIRDDDVIARVVDECIDGRGNGSVHILKSDVAVRHLLALYFDPDQTTDRKRRSAELLAKMDRRFVLSCLQALAAHRDGADAARAKEVIEQIGSWGRHQLPTVEELDEIRKEARARYQAQKAARAAELRSQSLLQILAALRSADTPTVGAAAEHIQGTSAETVELLLDALARYPYGWVSDDLVTAIRRIGPATFQTLWDAKVRDPNYRTLARLDLSFEALLGEGEPLPPAWRGESATLGLDPEEEYFVYRICDGWGIRPKSGSVPARAGEHLRVHREGAVLAVIDPGYRNGLVTAATIFGDEAVPTLRVLLENRDDEFDFQSSVLRAVGDLRSPDAVRILKGFAESSVGSAAAEAYRALASTGQPEAFQALFEAFDRLMGVSSQRLFTGSTSNEGWRVTGAPYGEDARVLLRVRLES